MKSSAAKIDIFLLIKKKFKKKKTNNIFHIINRKITKLVFFIGYLVEKKFCKFNY